METEVPEQGAFYLCACTGKKGSRPALFYE